MKFADDDFELYEALAKEFRLKTGTIFKSVLETTDLPQEVISELCAEFLSELCVNLDQGEWSVHGKSYRPLLCFLSGELQAWNDKTKLHPPYQAYQHHENVWGELD